VLREKTVDRLKKKSLDIVVATDVAARGLDVERISHVVNYDIPYDTEAYIHRIGRTGRAGRTGHAILFVAPRERRMLAAIEKATRHRIREMRLPTREDIAERRVEQFKEMLMGVLEAQELSFYRDFVDKLAKDQELDLLDIASALTFLAQKERPLIPAERTEREHFDDGRDARKRVERSDRPAFGGEKRERPFREREREFREPPREGEFRERREPREQREYDDSGTLYRIEVGRLDGVAPKDIVGAIANEAGIPGKSIGHIKLYDEFCTVSLPADLPPQTVKRMERIFIMGKPINLSLWTGEAPSGSFPRKRTYPPKKGE
jgi:ATP-dependent RNA helicase DeaD